MVRLALPPNSRHLPWLHESFHIPSPLHILNRIDCRDGHDLRLAARQFRVRLSSPQFLKRHLDAAAWSYGPLQPVLSAKSNGKVNPMISALISLRLFFWRVYCTPSICRRRKFVRGRANFGSRSGSRTTRRNLARLSNRTYQTGNYIQFGTVRRRLLQFLFRRISSTAELAALV